MELALLLVVVLVEESTDCAGRLVEESTGCSGSRIVRLRSTGEGA
jgi:hypothetical protein